MNEVRITPEMGIKAFTFYDDVVKDNMKLPPPAVFAWDTEVFNHLVRLTKAVKAEKYPVHIGTYEGQIIAVKKATVGAPVTVVSMEEMIVLGVNAFVGMGAAGSLQPEMPIGSMLIPDSILSGEGTSKHYMDADEIHTVTASKKLFDLLKARCENAGETPFTGRQWTTDAPYREKISDIEEYRKNGVMAVDMETSAMYVLGRFRSVAVCNLLVISDEVWDEWRPAFRTEKLWKRLEKACRIALSAAAGYTFSKNQQ